MSRRGRRTTERGREVGAVKRLRRHGDNGEKMEEQEDRWSRGEGRGDPMGRVKYKQ